MALSQRGVYVQGIHKSTTVRQLLEYFSRVGQVEDCVFRKTAVSDQETTEAYVIFAQADHVARAIRDFSGRTYCSGTLTLSILTDSQIAELDSLLSVKESATAKASATVAGEESKLDELVKLLSSLDTTLLTKAMACIAGAKAPDVDVKPKVKLELPSHTEPSPSSSTPMPPARAPSMPSPTVTSPTFQNPWVAQFPRLPSFSGDDGSKGDVSFHRWQYEVKSLIHDGYPMPVVMQSIRRSLRGAAADVLTWLPEDADSDAILHKMECLFGDVLTGENILQKFYSESQRADEAVSAWSCRLENLISTAVEKGKVSATAKNDMLRYQFWANLYDERIKNASRHLFDRISDYGELCIAVRAIEQEMAADEKRRKKNTQTKVQSHMMSDQQNTCSPSKTDLDTILAKLEVLTKKVEKLESIKKPTGRGRIPSDSVVCYRCGKSGHFANKCNSDTRISEDEVTAIKKRQQQLNGAESLPRGSQRPGADAPQTS